MKTIPTSIVLLLSACSGLLLWAVPDGIAASLMTVQGSTLSFPASDIASAGLPASTNLTGSNFLISAVSQTSHGGYARSVKSLQWSRSYNAFSNRRSWGYASALRNDGSLIVTGPSETQTWDSDIATVCYSADGTPLWTNRYDRGVQGKDRSNYAAVDNGSGDVCVLGQSMRFGTNSTLTDVVTIRYASNGIPVWTNIYNSFDTNGGFPGGLLVDNAGNAYVRVHSTLWEGSFGQPVEDALIKYDVSGSVVWTKHFFASAPDSGQGLHDIEQMEMDGNGDLFVAGSTGGQHYMTGNSVVKYDPDGVALFTNFFPFPAISQIQGLTMDLTNNLIITAATNTGCVVFKRLQNGSLVWTNSLNGPLYSGGNVPRTVVDPKENVFMIHGSPGSSPGLYQVLKISSAGIPLWTNLHADFGLTNSMIDDAAVDSAGNLYLAGHAPAVENGSSDCIILKFSTDGQLVWSNRLDGGANLGDIAFHLHERAGALYLSGQSERAAGRPDMWTAKLSDTIYYTPSPGYTGSDAITCTFTDIFGNSETTQVTVAVMPGSFHLSSVTFGMGGVPTLNASGFPGTNRVILEASGDLSKWQAVMTNTPVDGSVLFSDPILWVESNRFYRMFQTQ